jgi:hypothetical protein
VQREDPLRALARRVERDHLGEALEHGVRALENGLAVGAEAAPRGPG